MTRTPVAARSRMAAALSSTAATLTALLTLAVPVAAQVTALPADRPSLPLRLVEASDLNADPDIVEIRLTARVARVEVAPGQHLDAWTYDGGLPGPLIRTRVGNRLIVHFTNQLPQPTTVHWHGVRVPIAMDGVPGISQAAVPPGGEFTYDFVVPDAGLFWYHPHVMSAAQVGFGLTGALVVDDPAEQIPVAADRVLVLGDMAVQEDGTLEPPDSGGDAGTVFGREGQVVLLNGQVNPSLTLRAGSVQRWRFVNTAKSRYFQLVLDGQLFTIIGVDGGLIASPIERDKLVLAAGERMDVLVAPTGPPGGQLVLRALPFDRGYGSSEFRAVDDVLTMTFSQEPALPRQPMPKTSRVIAPLSTDGATRVSLDLTLVTINGKSEFQVNGAPEWKAKPIPARVGETQLWTITNHVKWSHPMHLHGFFFQVVDAQGQPVQPLAWKDTVDVPLNQTVRFLVKFDDREGEWMYHCHILDHADAGLMGRVRLGNPPPAAPHAAHDGAASSPFTP